MYDLRVAQLRRKVSKRLIQRDQTPFNRLHASDAADNFGAGKNRENL